MRRILAGGALAIVVAACGGTAATSPAPASMAATSAPPRPAATPTQPPAVTVVPTPEVTPGPDATPVEFDSSAYGYRAVFPAGAITGTPTPAAQPWDGDARIDSDGPYTDRFARPGSRLVFVYGAPTTLGLAAYAEDGQGKKH